MMCTCTSERFVFLGIMKTTIRFKVIHKMIE